MLLDVLTPDEARVVASGSPVGQNGDMKNHAPIVDDRAATDWPKRARPDGVGRDEPSRHRPDGWTDATKPLVVKPPRFKEPGPPAISARGGSGG